MYSKNWIMLFSIMVVLVAIIFGVTVIRRPDISEPVTPLPVLLPPSNGASSAGRADAPIVAPSAPGSMSHTDDVSDMHEPTLSPDFNPAALHQRIRSEPRDGIWAPSSEANMHAAVIDILRSRPGIDVQINCASTLCEARGHITTEVGIAGAASVMDLLQTTEFVDRLATHGQAFVMISSAKRADGTAFFLYSRRIA